MSPRAGWRIECGARECGADYALGWTFWQLPPGNRIILDDHMSLLEPLPIGYVQLYGKHQRYIHSNQPLPVVDEP